MKLRALSHAGLVLLALAAAGLLVFLAFQLMPGHSGGHAAADCTAARGGTPLNQPSNPLWNVPTIGWGGLVVLACGVGFLGGRVWADWRWGRARREAAPVHAALQLVLIGLFLFGSVALGYETFSLAGSHGNPDLWPITYYVRCADDVAGVPSLLAATIVAVLVGHWFTFEPHRSPD